MRGRPDEARADVASKVIADGEGSPLPSGAEDPGAREAWPRRASAACTVVGAACLWAWGYVASLSTALFPVAGVTDSIGIELAYYVSQLTLLVLGLAVAVALRRWHPGFSPVVAVVSASMLAGASLVLAAVMRLPAPPTGLVVVCGVAYGAGGLVLSIAWGARFSLGGRAMRRLVLLSFLLAYGIYLGSLWLPGVVARALACALPLVSGALWLLDSWRRHQLTSEVWPHGLGGEGEDARHLGEGSEGSTDAAILPWRTMGLFAVTSLVGNVVSSLIMGASYDGAAVIFPGAFLVCACITLAALAVVGSGEHSTAIERLYRYCLPFAVLGMLLILLVSASGGGAGAPGDGVAGALACGGGLEGGVLPAGAYALAGALVTGASVFLQALVVLKVTEAVQETGVSPMLAFGAGQGLIGGVVFAGNVVGRALSALPGGSGPLLALVCAAGVFALFFLLVMVADAMADRLASAAGVSPDGASEDFRIEAAVPGENGEAAEPDAGRGGDTEAAALAAFATRHGLTPREADVCAYLVRGRSLPFIAERLYVTAGTVKTHVMHIYRKADVTSKQELIDLYEAER